MRQAKRERDALRKLLSTGLYSGKVDLRKAPTRYQRGLIKKFADVVSGKAAVLKPAEPKTYAKLFKTVGDKVIVPRAKGEKLKVNKAGKIVGTRRVRGRKVMRRFEKSGEPGAATPGKEVSSVALPLARGDDIEWMRFRSRKDLDHFVFVTSPKIGETFKNYSNYIVEEDVEHEDDDEWLDKQLERKLRRRRRARKMKARTQKPAKRKGRKRG